MKKFLLDTHILIWLSENKRKIDSGIVEDIEYFQYEYFISVETLREIVILQSNNKLQLDYSIDKIAKLIEHYNFTIINTEPKHIKTLEKLPILHISNKAHDDPFDRLLISQAISEKFTLISADKKFPYYTNLGLKLLEN